ncbi:MAG TPA: hypothetical protein VGO62_00975 [Myxococcota bacterium]|jgi:hypothetical protein
MPPFALADAARTLLVVHALLAIATLGSSMHLGVLGVLLLVKKRAPTKLIRVHARVLAAGYGLTFLLGLVQYPVFRVLVRGVQLDRDAPWASNMFDSKEAFLLVGVPIVMALFLAGRRFELPRDRQALPFVGALGIAVAAIVLFASVAGLVVTSVRGPA